MYPARCGFYSKFFIYKQTGLSQLFIVLLALILTFMSLLLTYHSLVYTSVPACALELGPCEPWPGSLARSRGSRRQSVNGRGGWWAVDGQLTHRQSLTRRRGCRRGRPPATVPGAGAVAPWPGCGLRRGEKERASKGRRRKEERADGSALLKGCFCLRVGCQLDRSPVPSKTAWKAALRATLGGERCFTTAKPSVPLPFQLPS